jgi:hypothetical protein
MLRIENFVPVGAPRGKQVEAEHAERTQADIQF